MCEMDDYDAEPVGFWQETPVKRSSWQRRCSACSALIAKGEPYLSVSYGAGGDAWRESMCSACRDVAETFSKEHDSYRLTPSGLFDAVERCVELGTEEEAARWQAVLDVMRARNRAAGEAAP